MPKVPNVEPRRVKFCVNCEREIQWQATRCRTCGAKQPALQRGPLQKKEAIAAELRNQIAEGEKPTDVAAAVMILASILGLALVVIGVSQERVREWAIGASLLWLVFQWLIIRSAVLSALIAASRRERER